MHRITNQEEFRSNVRNELLKIIKNKNICENLEKGILNYSIEMANEKNLVKKWDNMYFAQIYIDRLRTIIVNLKKNKNLLKDIREKKIRAHKLAFMSHQEMLPERWEELINKKKIRDQHRYTPKLDANTDNFTCRKCKSTRCSYYQLQTRSADEPMTTFVTCIDCGSRWKC
tara:strand:+ start:3339 stop:3851 length:513 start_codon:yes stop_codon:yes gene_type:complete